MWVSTRTRYSVRGKEKAAHLGAVKDHTHHGRDEGSRCNDRLVAAGDQHAVRNERKSSEHHEGQCRHDAENETSPRDSLRDNEHGNGDEQLAATKGMHKQEEASA